MKRLLLTLLAVCLLTSPCFGSERLNSPEYLKLYIRGNSNVDDYSGNGLNGTWSGDESYVTTPWGQTAMEFDGTGDMVTIANFPEIDNDITIACWIKNNQEAGDDFLIQKQGAGNYGLYSIYGGDSGGWGFTVNENASSVTLSENSYNKWSFLTATYNGAKQQWYLNAEWQSSASYSTDLADSTSTLSIGAFSSFLTTSNVAELRIYSCALTQDEIQTLYELNLPQFSPPQQPIIPNTGSLKNLIFFEEYESGNSLEADVSVGVPTATMTVTRGASNPATYVDSDGVVQTTTTSNTGRMTSGYYGATGFVSSPGLRYEGTMKNEIERSIDIENALWTKTNVTADNDDSGSSSPDGTATAPSITATAANGTLLLASGVTAETYSVYLKRKTGTGTISITADGGSTYDTVTVSTDWRRFQVTEASASQTCGIKIATSGDAVYVWGNQFEAEGWASSYIPTTSGGLTRNAERLSYKSSGNRNVNEETIFVKASLDHLGSAFANETTLMDNDTTRRYFGLGAGTIQFYPSIGLGAGSNGSTVPVANQTYVFTGACKYNASPDTQVYVDGTSEVSATHGWVPGTIGTNFYVGSIGGGTTRNWGGIIKSVAIFDEFKEYYDVTEINDWLDNSDYHIFKRMVPDSSLVLHVTDGTKDLSRYDHTLTNSGAVLGDGMEFDGSDSLVSTPATTTISSYGKSGMTVGGVDKSRFRWRGKQWENIL